MRRDHAKLSLYNDRKNSIVAKYQIGPGFSHSASPSRFMDRTLVFFVGPKKVRPCFSNKQFKHIKKVFIIYEN